VVTGITDETQERLQRALPDEIGAAVGRHGRAGTSGRSEQQELARFYAQRHVLGIDQPPEYLTAAMQDASEHPDVREALDRQFQDWDITPRLGEIGVPSLVLVGRHGIATPALAETIAGGIPQSTLVAFEQSAHFPYITETDRYLQTVEQFLEKVESGVADPR
jgi:proline iminopeptidase